MPEAKIIQIGSSGQAAASDVTGHMVRILSQLGLSSDTDYVDPGDVPALRRSLVHGLQSCNVVVTIGSFGQYGVSGTKETVFKALGIPFVPVPAVKERVLHFLKAKRIPMTEELESLWSLPRNAEPFPSENGVDSGFGITAGGQCILMLPSDPDSFHPMAAGDALAFLARFFGLESARRRVNCFGLSQQSIVDELYGDILKDNLPLTYPASCHNGLETSLWVTACAATREKAEEICQPAVFRLQQELKDVVYAVDADSMEESVLELLRDRGRTLCLTESYSSGALAQAIERGTERMEGSESPVLFYGSYMLASETAEIGLPRRKLRGRDIVTPAGAGMMAEYCRRKGQENSLGLSLCLDEAVRQVYVALSDGERVYLLIRSLPDDCYGNRAGEYGSLCAMRLVQQYFLNPHALPAGTPVRMAAAGLGFPEAEDPNWEEKLGLPPENNLGRRVVMLVCAVVFAVSASFLGHQKYLAWDSGRQKAELETIYIGGSSQGPSSSQGEPSQDNSSQAGEEYPGEYLHKFSALYDINPDIRGWLSIDGTEFSYPVVQSGQDTAESQYYLRRDFNGDYNTHGVPFLDYRADLKRPSDNLVIYGHNMRDGTMFEELLNYKDLDYYKEHPVIRFDSVYEEAEYRVAAVFITNTLKSHGDLFEYHNFINSPSDDDFDDFIYGVQIRSILNTGVDLRAGDKLLTLSTCSYEFKGARFVVVARKLRDGESPDQARDTSSASKNENVLYPDIWYSLYKQEKPNVSLMRVVLPKVKDTVNLMMAPSETAPPSELADVAPLPPVAVRSDPSSGEPEGGDGEQSSGDGSEAASSSEAVPPGPSEGSSLSSESQVVLTVPDSSTSSASISAPEPLPSSSQEAPEPSSSSESSRPESVSSSDSVPTPAPSSSRPGTITISASSKSGIIIRPASSLPEEDLEELPDEKDETGDSEDGDASQEDDPEVGGNYTGDETLSVYINGSRRTDSAYDIVCQVVAAEMGSGHKEALKAQAVAAYTYISYENARGVSPSVAAKSASAAVQAAVGEVIGEALYYKGSLAFTCYHATSAGKTNSSKDVWGGSYPYLVSVDSSIDEDAYRYEDTKRISSEAVAASVEKQLGITLDGDPADWFEVLSYTDGGYNDRMSVGGETQYYYDSNRKYYPITGRVLREAVLGLRSACFTVEYLENRDEFLFTTYGYGHGVGMSQTGAMLMANQGDSYVDILEHYFPGTTVR